MKIVLDRTLDYLRQKPFLLTLVLCCATFISVTGCRLIDKTASAPKRTVQKFFPDGQPTQPEPAELQQSLLQFAQAYCLRIVESANELQNAENGPLTDEEVLRFKISSVGGILMLSTGDNPYISLLNLVSQATLSRMILENYWVTILDEELFESWISRSRSLEQKIWFIADQVLSKDQQDELRLSIENHYASLKHLDSLSLANPQDLVVPTSLKGKANNKSVFSLAAINPLSGLDPAVREITLTRLFAERALFTLQWTPWLLRWQSDLMVLDTTRQTEIAQALKDISSLSESIERASLAAESISKTAAALPDQLSTEREAIVTALNTQEGQITTLFQAGTDLSVSMNTAIESLDALMKRFGVGEPHAPRDPNRKRFDILDYAKTADSFTATAEQLNETLIELNTTLDSPALDKLSNQATADVRGILNHVFLLAAGLVVLILVSALIYRVVAGRRSAAVK
jgi:hypothetical protein